MATLENLPDDLKAQYITYLSFGEVENLCNLPNKRLRNFCMGKSPNSKRVWRELILTTFKDVSYLNDILNDKRCGQDCWNYLTYTQLVKELTPVTQAMIYFKSGDKEALAKLPLYVRNIAYAFLNKPGRVADVKGFGVRMMDKVHIKLSVKLAKYIMEKDWTQLTLNNPNILKYPEVVRFILNNNPNIMRDDVIQLIDTIENIMESNKSHEETFNINLSMLREKLLTM